MRFPLVTGILALLLSISYSSLSMNSAWCNEASEADRAYRAPAFLEPAIVEEMLQDVADLPEDPTATGEFRDAYEVEAPEVALEPLLTVAE
jgi:hypothetical protein